MMPRGSSLIISPVEPTALCATRKYECIYSPRGSRNTGARLLHRRGRVHARAREEFVFTRGDRGIWPTGSRVPRTCSKIERSVPRTERLGLYTPVVTVDFCFHGWYLFSRGIGVVAVSIYRENSILESWV